MAKVNLSEYSKALDEFTKNAERFKVSKAELDQNLPQLREAIALFERLSKLQQGLDPSSPRAKNYYALMQSIASINNGWQYNQAQIKREAQLADADKATDRLSAEESRKLLQLMGSSTLKNFVQFLDADNPSAFRNLKSVVEFSYATPQRQPEDTPSVALSRRLSAWHEATWQELDQEKGELEKEKASKLQTLDLNQHEEARQEEVREQQIAHDVKTTSDAIKASLVEKKPSAEVKVKSKPIKTKSQKTESFLDDLKSFLKWTIGAGAAIAGIAWVLDDVIKYLVDLEKETRDLKEGVQKFIDDRKKGEDKNRGAWVDPERAAQDYTSQLLKAQRSSPQFFKDVRITPEKITMLHAMYRDHRDDWKSKAGQYIASLFGEGLSRFEIDALNAVAQGQNVAAVTPDKNLFTTADPSGLGYVYNVDYYVGNPEDTDFAANQTRALAGARRASSLATHISPQWEYRGGWGNPLNLSADIGNFVYRKFGDDTRVPFTKDELYSMRTEMLEAMQLKYADEALSDWFRRGGDIRSSVAEGEQKFRTGVFHLDLFNLGEVIRNSTDPKFDALRAAQSAGDIEGIAVEISKIARRKITPFDPMVRETLHYDDYASPDEKKFEEFLFRNNENYNPEGKPRDSFSDFEKQMPQYRREQAQLQRVQSTVLSNYTTFTTVDNSNQQVPGEL